MGEKNKKVIKPEDEKARIKEMAREDRYKKIRERDMKLFGPNEELTESDKREALNNALLKAGSPTPKPAPTPMPTDANEEAGEYYRWDEPTTAWVKETRTP